MTIALPLMPQPDHRKAVGRRLRLLIDALGMTQAEAARIMGVSPRRLGNWIAGDHYPHLYAVFRLCTARGVDANYVVLGDRSWLPHVIALRVEEAMRDHRAEVSAEPQVPE